MNKHHIKIINLLLTIGVVIVSLFENKVCNVYSKSFKHNQTNDSLLSGIIGNSKQATILESFTISGQFWDVLGGSLEGMTIELISAINDSILATTQCDKDGNYTFKTNFIRAHIVKLTTDLKVYDNYPNPFNGSTLICFDMYKTGNATVLITNVLGQTIEMKNFLLGEGNHKFRWNPKQASAGQYFLTIIAHGQKDIKKMMLLNGVGGGSGLEQIGSGVLKSKPLKNTNRKLKKPVGAVTKVRLTGYKQREKIRKFYTYTSQELSYTGGSLQVNAPQIPFNPEFSPFYYTSWLNMFKELTMTNFFGPFRNTIIRKPFLPIELYGVTNNVPHSPKDWLPYLLEAIGDSNNITGRGWEDKPQTGLDLFVLKNGEVGEAEQSKTKVGVHYVTTDKMPHPGSNGEFYWDKGDINNLPLRGDLYINTTSGPLGGDMNFIYAVMAHELGRTLNLDTSHDPNHIMRGGVLPTSVISKDEASIINRLLKNPEKTTLIIYQ